MAEYTSSGIWSAEPVGLFRHGMVSHSRLGLSRDLGERFDYWIDQYWQLLYGGFDATSFNVEGQDLALALKRHVGPTTEVIYAGVDEEAKLLPERVIEI